MDSIKQEYQTKVNICLNHIESETEYLKQLLTGMKRDSGEISDSVYAQAVESSGTELKRYANSLENLSREYLQWMQTDSAEYIDGRRQFTETEKRNGGHAVECMDSAAARDFCKTHPVNVYEYQNPDKSAPLDHWTLYAYDYGDEYGEGLTATEMQETLEGLSMPDVDKVQN